MRKIEFLPCIPTRGTKVPAGPDWLHEIKHDGCRLRTGLPQCEPDKADTQRYAARADVDQ
jgi:hypothetical protein